MDLIERFDKYFSKLEEALTSPQNIEWEYSKDKIFGFFEVENFKYRIEYFKQIGHNYSYCFSIFRNENWSYDISKIGHGFRVLSTITFSFEDLFEKTKPNSIIFSAIDDSETRKQLYEKFCKDFCEKYNYKLSNRGNQKMVMFVLFNPNLDDVKKEEIFQSVQKLVEQGK